MERLTKLAWITVLNLCLAAGAIAAQPDAGLIKKLTKLAEAGSAPAQYNLGMLYNNGIGTTADLPQAFQWFEKAAAAGDPLASYKVGCYYAGQFEGVVPLDADKALAAKLVAAQAGYALAQQDVGTALAGKGNHQEATKWWAVAAEQGDVRSLVYMSEIYRRGQGLPPDAGKALEFMLKVEKVLPETQRPQLQPRLASLKAAATPEQISQSEVNAKAWKPVLAALTIRANLGINEARQLVR